VNDFSSAWVKLTFLGAPKRDRPLLCEPWVNR
jgi:hypothetical protein